VTEAELLVRREVYGPMLPDRTAVVTAGVDVQDDRVEVSVYAWTKAEECWLMAHQVIPGDPSTPALWAALNGFLLKPWAHPLLGPVNIHAVCIDSGGHFTQAVCDFCEQRRGQRAWAIKGVAGARPVWPRRQSKAAKGKVYVIGVDSCRMSIRQRLKLTEGPGCIHFSPSMDLPFFEQITSEFLKTECRRGRPERTWERRKDRAAEAWDSAVYSLAAIHGLASHGISLDAEADRVELLRQPPQATAANPYQVYRSRFVGG
jgi:phage terminase large subunit GpA-like protein